MASQVPFKFAEAHRNLETVVLLAVMAACSVVAQHFVHPQGLFKKLFHKFFSWAISSLVKFNHGSDPRYEDESLLEYLDALLELEEAYSDESPDSPAFSTALAPPDAQTTASISPMSILVDQLCSILRFSDDKIDDETNLESPTTASSPSDSDYKSMLSLTPNSISPGYSSPDTLYTPPSAPTSPKTASYFPDLKRIPRTCRQDMESFLPAVPIESEFAMYQNELLGRPYRRVQSSLEYQWNFYEGEPTRAFDCIQEILEPLSLLIVLTPSDDPLVMQQRYNELVVLLSSDIVMSEASAIHSIDICVPYCPGFLFESTSHPYDNSDSGYYGVSDALHPMRYKNEFPNLVEFGWVGPLGRRKGDGVYAALPAPFHDIVSLPFSQMRRLEFHQCFLTLSDCCLMLDSSPSLETLVVDTLIGTSLQAPPPGLPHPLPVWPEAPLHGPPTLGFVRVDGFGMDRIEAPSLTSLEVRTTVNLGHFLRQLDAPLLESLVYESAGPKLECMTGGNCPWTGLKASLQNLVVRSPRIEKAVANDLQDICELKGIELGLYSQPTP